jgi:hypothetical protein
MRMLICHACVGTGTLFLGSALEQLYSWQVLQCLFLYSALYPVNFIASRVKCGNEGG